jgi:hypothetical protein
MQTKPFKLVAVALANKWHASPSRSLRGKTTAHPRHSNRRHRRSRDGTRSSNGAVAFRQHAGKDMHDFDFFPILVVVLLALGGGLEGLQHGKGELD